MKSKNHAYPRTLEEFERVEIRKLGDVPAWSPKVKDAELRAAMLFEARQDELQDELEDRKKW
ncbi:hypothetical protein [Gemmatimonas groenlandica]|uniref:Uncharacterized protein n=1 Tax=Gemmatimonas groenlandica TaxID=2732249 RepID=A0A6M4IMT6_9BACT|nr:hypothetical protein [Gemmatimonas groenlandica]QJR35228.1 hypothetical protein HKW67_06775 [Gemmatimonas groenlandica]